MPTNQEIRRANLEALLDECTRELGTERGAQALLAARTGVPAPFISQLRNERDHQGGKARKMGDPTARKLEKGMNLPRGWMDVDHSSGALSEVERTRLQTLRALTPEQLEAVMLIAAEYVRLNRSEPPPTPRPDVPGVKH